MVVFEPPLIAESWPRRVRGMLDRQVIVDSLGTMLMIPPDGLPVYFFPPSDLAPDLLIAAGKPDHETSRGMTRVWSIRTAGKVIEEGAWSLIEPVPELAALRDMVAFRWQALDSWYEEDDEIFVHPKSPYHRIDVLHSSRHIRVELNGHVLADSRRPRLLFETGLPIRYYIPTSDVNMDLLRPSRTVTQCPYKGMASYWSAELGNETVRDVAWMYRYPVPECPKIEALVSFFNERCDLVVDGQLQARPITPWS
ncbi:DUF427 domain-containing protein [Catelliglobosispora koreensis]|uniref:DUF427 domain-containing protein n=1 Tax=Catelliglobosispora koreensis TaxID=129052 RepID=UPI000382362B|nr:DUF427 domain-containing protein [Catelliglobosispora koreensis]